MDRFSTIGNYVKNTNDNATRSLKRPVRLQESVERIRDIFDPTDSMKAFITSPSATKKVTLDINFRPKSPAIECCADCMCGVTESYTSDSLISGSIYTAIAYVPSSTVVYLDGVMAARNTDYVEANPTTGQLDILQDFSVITISYVYTVGNCSGNPCPEDTKPCLEFTLFSGLSTVFADRMDRAYYDDDIDNNLGGCGNWVTSINSTTGIPAGIESVNTGAGEASISSIAALAGPARVVGKTFEIITAIGAGSSISLTGIGHTYTVSFTFDHDFSTTQSKFTISGLYRAIDTTDIVGDNIIQGNVSADYTFPREDAARFVRAAQYPTGSWVIKTWRQDQDESSAYILTVTSGNVVVSSSYSNIELILPTIYAVSVDTSRLQAIRIGGGADAGDYDLQAAGSNSGAFLSTCYLLPDFGPGQPYFCGCGSTSTTSTMGTQTSTNYHVGVSFPVIIGDTPPDGSGLVSDISHRVASLKTVLGRPTGFRIRGQVRATFAVTTTVGIVFEAYDDSANSPNYSETKYNGTSIGSATLTTDGTWVDFEVVVPTGDRARWGVAVADPHGFASAQPFIPGGFLFPPCHSLDITTRNVIIEAFSNIQCNARDICGLCADDRCPPIQDEFISESYTPAFSTPSSITGYRQPASGATMEINWGDGTTFEAVGGGVGRIAFSNVETTGSSAFYLKYPNSPFACREPDTNVAASIEFKLNTLSPAGGYADLTVGGFSNGPYIYISWGAGALINSYVQTWSSAPSIPLSLSAGVWYTVDYQTSGDDIMCRVYPTGSPSGWTTASAFDVEEYFDFTETFYIAGGYSFNASVPNQEIDIKNITVGVI